MEATVTSNGEKVVAFFKAIDAHDFQKVQSFWADGHQMHFPSGAPGLNKEVHAGFTQMFVSAFPDLQHMIEDVIEAGNKVITRGFFTGTHQGNFNGIPSTGKQVKASWIDITEFDSDGKVVNEWVELDSIGLMQQLGVVPANN